MGARLRIRPMTRLCIALCVASAMLTGIAQALTIRVTQADGARVQVTLHPEDVLRVELPAEPAAGRTWSVLGHTPAPLTALGATQRVFGGRLSNQGTSSFAWRAASAGDGDVTLGYGSAAERSTQPERIVRLHVTVAGEPLAPAAPATGATATEGLAGMDHVGTWTRTRHCGDCSALAEQLDLYRTPRGRFFLLRRKYQDAPGGTLTSIADGVWTESSGTADPAATLYQILGEGVAYLLRVDGDRLAPLDAQQIPLPATAGEDTAFHRQPAQ